MITVHSWGPDNRCKHCCQPRSDAPYPQFCPRKPPTVRAAARSRWPLDGADAQALEGALANVEHLLGELLADIHGDGGHYRAEHGLEASCRAAHKRIESLRAQLEAAEESRRMACENTPTRGCECPGCGYAREVARME